MAITLTESAIKRVQEYIQAEKEHLTEGEPRLRVGVKGGGCSGFSYLLDLTAEPPGEMDEEIEAGGVKVLIDQKSVLYLEGTVIDYVSDGPLREGFVFKNPNATSSCGCGSSFSA
jgi:iron-sulfur cluster assembly protein